MKHYGACSVVVGCALAAMVQDGISGRNALVMGINEYSLEGCSTLACCVNDANGMANNAFLDDPSGRWSSDKIAMLTNSQATKSAVRAAITSAAGSLGANDLAVYYQSSHGGWNSSSNSSYLCMYDETYYDSEMAADLAQFNTDTKIIVIIDACHSGGMFNQKDAAPENWNFAERVMSHYNNIMGARYRGLGVEPPKSLGQNIAFMTACASNEYSWENSYFGLFTGTILKGTRLPSVDTNGDGDCQFSELFNYAKNVSSAKQHPQSYNDNLLGSISARALGKPISAGDYDADGKSDLAVFETAAGYWYILPSSTLSLSMSQFGNSACKVLPGDYDGDGKADLAVFETATGYWYILRSSTLDMSTTPFGNSSCLPVAGDYDHDGKTDLAVYETTSGLTYILYSSSLQLDVPSISAGSSRPVSGDFDGDGRTDVGLYTPASGTWNILLSVNSALSTTQFGNSGCLPVAGDYDGDGKSDLAVFETATGYWYILPSATLSLSITQFGNSGCLPVAGDYDGDGKSDLAVFETATGYWYILPSATLSLSITKFGNSGCVVPR